MSFSEDENTVLRLRAKAPETDNQHSLNPELENFPMSSENSDDRNFRAALI